MTALASLDAKTPEMTASSSMNVINSLDYIYLIAIIACFLTLAIIASHLAFANQLPRNVPSTSTQDLGSISRQALNSTPKNVGLISSQGTGPSDSLTSFNLENESAASASTGAETRSRFFLLLFVACTGRVVSLIADIILLVILRLEMRSGSSLYRAWAFISWFPALLYVSMYGLVLLFWTQLCYACWGNAFPWPRKLFFLFNVMLYGIFFILFLVLPMSDVFWQTSEFIIGSIYFVGFFGILYYSIRLVLFFRKESPDDVFFFDLPTENTNTRSKASPRQVVLQRISIVCTVLCILFAIKAVFLLGSATRYIAFQKHQTRWSLFETQNGLNQLEMEFGIHWLTEALPCGLLVCFMWQSKRPQPVLMSNPSPLHRSTSHGQVLRPMTPNISMRRQMNPLTNPSTEEKNTLLGQQYQTSSSYNRLYGTNGTTSTTTGL